VQNHPILQPENKLSTAWACDIQEDREQEVAQAQYQALR
jgi:hypothetical protein